MTNTEIMNAVEDFIRANLVECAKEELECQKAGCYPNGKLFEAKAMLIDIAGPRSMDLVLALLRTEMLKFIANQ